jgi:hypothetical protein
LEKKPSTIYWKVKALLLGEMHYYHEEKESVHYNNPNPKDITGYSAYSRFSKFDEQKKGYSRPPFVYYLFDQPLFHSRSIEWTGWVRHGSRSSHKDVDSNVELIKDSDYRAHFFDADGEKKKAVLKTIIVLLCLEMISMIMCLFIWSINFRLVFVKFFLIVFPEL